MDSNLKERRIKNLLKAIELKNAGIQDKSIAKIVDYVIDYEISELQLKVVLFEKKQEVENGKSIFKGK